MTAIKAIRIITQNRWTPAVSVSMKACQKIAPASPLFQTHAAYTVSMHGFRPPALTSQFFTFCAACLP